MAESLAAPRETPARIVPLVGEYLYLQDLHEAFFDKDCLVGFPTSNLGEAKQGYLHHDTASFGSYTLMERAEADVQSMVVYEVGVRLTRATVSIRRRSPDTPEGDARQDIAFQETLGLTVPNDEDMAELRRLCHDLVEYIEQQSVTD